MFDEPMTVIVLATILFFVGNAFAGGNAAVHKSAKVTAGAAFLLFCFYHASSDLDDWIPIVLHALILAFLTFSVSLILFSVLAFLSHATPKPNPRRVQAYQRRPEPKQAPPPPPPPPSCEEQVALAKRQYEKKLEILKTTIPPEHFETAKQQLYKAFLQQVEAILE